MDRTECVNVDPRAVEEMYRWRDRVEKALRIGGDGYTFRDVLAAVEAGRAQLWATPGAIIVTQIEEYPAGRVCRFWIAAGRLPDVLRIAPEVYAWAKEVGCVAATLTGRRGWERVLGSQGWRRSPLVMYERDI